MTGFVARLGLAITHPRSALAIAADRKSAGRSGTDFILLILLILAATQLRGLFGALWLGTAVEAGLGLRAAIQVLTHALSVQLGFLVISALAVWLASGPGRDLGRSFDLACVAAVPMLLVDLFATVVVRIFDLAIPAGGGIALSLISFGWAGVLLALALRPARQPAAPRPAPPIEILRSGRLAGLVVIAIAVTGTVVQTVWIARNTETMRPMTQGDPAPEVALPVIGARGVLGERVTLASLEGTVVVIDFWATWCKPCLSAMPRLDALIRKHPEIAVLAVNLDDPAQARALWDERGYRMRLLADDGQVSERYGVRTIPHTVIIDRFGVVRSVTRGSSGELESTVTSLLAEQIRK